MCQIELSVSRLEQAATQVLGCGVEELTKESYDMYGLCVFSGCGQEVAIGTDEEADKAAAEYIKDSLWSIRPEYIASHTKRGASNGMIKAITALQEACEDCNDDILCLIEDIDEFIMDAISADGRGTFLSPFDSEEKEIDIDGKTFYAYRLN